MAIFIIHCSNSSYRNFEYVIDPNTPIAHQNTWGSENIREGMNFNTIALNDIVLFAGGIVDHEGTNRGRNLTNMTTIGHLHFTRVSQGYFCSAVPQIWQAPAKTPQYTYPHRFKFDLVHTIVDFDVSEPQHQYLRQQFQQAVTANDGNSARLDLDIDLIGYLGINPENIPPELQQAIDDNPPNVPPNANAPVNEPNEPIVEDGDIPHEPPSEEDDNTNQDDHVEEAEPTPELSNIGKKFRKKDDFNVSEADASKDCLHKLMLSKSLILEGVPGTGKTYAFNNDLVDKWENNWANESRRACEKNADAITMHPSTSYEDFIEGLRPTEVSKPSTDLPIPVKDRNTPEDTLAKTKWFFNTPSKVKGNFSVTDGFFLNVCKEAVQHPDKDFLVLLDEINRCNIPSVFGDLLTAIERSKRAVWKNPTKEEPNDGHWDLSKAQIITLAISKRKLFVPENVYVVGTMNTTDRSVAPMDMALRRRFAFHRIEPIAPVKTDFPQPNTYWDNLYKSIQAIEALNTSLAQWGMDALLGYSYIYDLAADLERYANHQNHLIEHHWNHHILPQLSDILFSNQIVDQKLNDLLNSITDVTHGFTITNTSTHANATFERPSLVFKFPIGV